MRTRIPARWAPLVVALSLALTVPVALTPVAAAATGGGLGKPAVAEQRVSKVREVTGLGAKKARATAAKAQAANVAQAKRAAAEQMASWPTAAEDTAQIPGRGKAKFTAGGLPVTIARPDAKGAVSGQARVRVLSREAAKAAGIRGILLTADAADPGTAEVSVDYSAFRVGIRRRLVRPLAVGPAACVCPHHAEEGGVPG